MKKIFNLILVMFFVIFFESCATTRQLNPNWTKDPRVEVINEQTVIFRDVVKIEITTSDKSQVTYLYDLKRSKSVSKTKGSFAIELKRGDYLIQSNKRITKTVYDVILM